MITEDDVLVDRVLPLKGDGITKAFVSVRVGPIIIKGFRVVTTINKDTGDEMTFVGNPSQPNKDGKYYDTVFIDDEEFNKALKRKVLRAWYEAVKTQQGVGTQS